MKADGWIERVTHLNQWRRGGERAQAGLTPD